MLKLGKLFFFSLLLSSFSLNTFAQDISAELFNTTIKIFAYNEKKAKEQSSIGTGFFFIFQTDLKREICIVTNKHVIENFSKGKMKFNEFSYDKKNKNQIEIHLSNFSNLWIMHPTEDIAVLPFSPIQQKLFSLYKKTIEVKAFSEGIVPKANEDTALAALLNVLMIGYPKGFYDTINNIPIIRRGLTATPVYENYNNKKHFLVDIPIFTGSSGSPIVWFENTYMDKRGNLLSGQQQILLLGIATEAKEYKSNELPIWLPLNIATVIKSSVILDLKDQVLKILLTKKYQDLFYFNLII